MLAPILMAAGGAGLVASLFLRWTQPSDFLVLFGAADRLAVTRRTGWEQWAFDDVAFVVLAAALAAAAVMALRRRLPRRALAAGAVVCAAAIVVMLRDGYEEFVFETAGPGSPPEARTVIEPAAGPYVATAALGIALIGCALAWLRPRA